MTNSIKDRDEEEPSFVRPHPLATLACLGGLGYALPAIAWRPDLLPPPDFAFGLGEFMLFLAEDYRQGGLGDFRVFCIQYSAERLNIQCSAKR